MPDKPKPRWYHFTPDRFLIGLLLVLGVLLLSEWFCWFPFNERKGWTVLIAIGTVCVAVLLLLLWFALSLIFRRRFQFSVRSLLVLVVAMATGCSWLAVKMQDAKNQKEAVKAIHEAGGRVWYGYEDRGVLYEAPRVLFALRPNQPAPAWLLNLLGEDFFCDVSLVFLGKEFSDQGTAHLGRLSSLRGLDLSNTQVSDAGLEHLKGLTNLHWLDLSNNQVTDVGLEHLQGLTSLEWLGLRGTRVTDEGLEYLEGLGNLTSLDLGLTQATDEGAKKLLTALPNCDISL